MAGELRLPADFMRSKERESRTVNYQRIYDQLIVDRRINPPLADRYIEVHHIVPRCMGGGNEHANLIRLTAEDHFFAHLLLARIHGGRLWAAVHLMDGSRLTGTNYLKRVDGLSARARYARLSKLARSRQSGDNSPSSDKTSYAWENLDGREFYGPRWKFKDTFLLDGRGIDNVLTGYAKTVLGWFVPCLLSSDDLVRLRSGITGTRTDRAIYHFRHNELGDFFGERWQFARHAKVSRSMAQRLTSGGCYTASGWYIPALNAHGVHGKYYTTGDRNGAAVKTAYEFKHVSGVEFAGTRMALVEKYGLNRQAVHNMAKGASATSGGWYMVKDGEPMHAANDNIHGQSCMELVG
jgi:hypothetical protein